MPDVTREQVTEKVLEIIRRDCTTPDKRIAVRNVAHEVIESLQWTSTMARTEVKKVIQVLNLAKVVKLNYDEKYVSLNGQAAATVTLEEYTKLKLERDNATSDKRLIGQKLEGTIAEVEVLKQKLNQAELAKSSIREIVIKQGEETRKVSGIFHAQFPKLVQLASARKNIFIYGPTGCGKSHVCGQLAEALGLPFAFVSCTAGMSEAQLGGRLLPVGAQGTFEYVISEFIRCYEEGGVFLLDEIDAADPNVLLLVNAALANGHVAVPNRPARPYAKRHKDFICIAAANTVGTGADRLYSGRNKLDAATLDRFQIGKVFLDYDTNVESILCPDDELRTRLLRYRNAVNQHKLERAISSRFLRDAYDMKQIGWSDVEIDSALFQGWREDEVTKVKTFRG